MTSEYIRPSAIEQVDPKRFTFEADTAGDAKLLADLQFGEDNYNLWQVDSGGRQWIAEPKSKEEN